MPTRPHNYNIFEINFKKRVEGAASFIAAQARAGIGARAFLPFCF